MNKNLFGAAASLALFATVAFAADLTPQQVNRVDVTQLADGYRASKIIGAPVVNEANEPIGKVDDVLVGRNDSCPSSSTRRARSASEGGEPCFAMVERGFSYGE